MHTLNVTRQRCAFIQTATPVPPRRTPTTGHLQPLFSLGNDLFTLPVYTFPWQRRREPEQNNGTTAGRHELQGKSSCNFSSTGISGGHITSHHITSRRHRVENGHRSQHHTNIVHLPYFYPWGRKVTTARGRGNTRCLSPLGPIVEVSPRLKGGLEDRGMSLRQYVVVAVVTSSNHTRHRQSHFQACADDVVISG